MYLLDTNVISELRRPRPHGAVLSWLNAAAAADLHVSAVTIGEIQSGIENTRETDASKATELEAWLDQIAASMSILSMDVRCFRLAARLMHRRPGHLAEDAMIAATGAVHGLTVVTRNLRDFTSLGVRTLDPFTPDTV
jgi:predicted nucleic acid-binding protein